MATIADKLRWYLEDYREISQKEFAEESGIEPGSISRILNGKALPSIPSLMLLRDATGIWGDYWLDDSASIPPRKKFFVKP